MQFDTKGQRILVADGDRAVLEMLQIRLDVAGYVVNIARTGPAALEAIRTFRPAAVVMDLNLPEMNALEVLCTLNPQGGKMSTPILLIGRKLAIEDVKTAVGLGARDALAKPFSGADFLDRVARLLRKPAMAA